MASASVETATPAGAAAAAPDYNLWDSILAEVGTSKQIPTKTLLVLGDRNCGKSNLLQRFRKRANKASTVSTKPELALSYSYLEIDEEKEGVFGRISTWQLEGESSYGQLLNFALSETALKDTMAVICLDFTKPWTFLETLEKWIGILTSALASLKLDRKTSTELTENLANYIQNYSESVPDSQTGIVFDPSRVQEGEPQALPLKGAVLSENIGIPIIVVCLKTDHIATLEKEAGYRDTQFDFIQYQLRKFCLNYGAALTYVSVNQNKNCEEFYKYLMHRLFHIPSKVPSQVIQKDNLFVAAGWDSEKKISLLLEGASFKEDTSYTDIIKKPDTQMSFKVNTEYKPKDEQQFLQGQLEVLNSTNPEDASASNVASAGGAMDSPDQLKRNARFQTPTKTGSPVGGSGNLPGADASKQEPKGEVLASFFKGLLDKKTSTGAASKTQIPDRQHVTAELDKMRSSTNLNSDSTGNTSSQ